MLKATHTVTINAAFLQEIKDDNEQLRVLLAQVRDICESRLPTDMPTRQFASLLAELRDQLAMHFALEEAYEDISRLAETARDISCRNGDSRGIQHLASCFLEIHGRLQTHESEENDLIMRAYNMDIGGSG